MKHLLLWRQFVWSCRPTLHPAPAWSVPPKGDLSGMCQPGPQELWLLGWPMGGTIETSKTGSKNSGALISPKWPAAKPCASPVPAAMSPLPSEACPPSGLPLQLSRGSPLAPLLLEVLTTPTVADPGYFPIPCESSLILNYPFECVTSFLNDTKFKKSKKWVRGVRSSWYVTNLSFFRLRPKLRTWPDLSKITMKTRQSHS